LLDRLAKGCNIAQDDHKAVVAWFVYPSFVVERCARAAVWSARRTPSASCTSTAGKRCARGADGQEAEFPVEDEDVATASGSEGTSGS
jgi:hypothetical protein